MAEGANTDFFSDCVFDVCMGAGEACGEASVDSWSGKVLSKAKTSITSQTAPKCGFITFYNWFINRIPLLKRLAAGAFTWAGWASSGRVTSKDLKFDRNLIIFQSTQVEESYT